ncbi:hypothetical protein ILUMI_11856 [Ignelater luminosus]|uniref:Uncharacterized protein n=1 Tax=Ignelater luminosus TaxID=2038154 RepID=A0A8K0D0P2_IGNLU|nr:hypothetical protein ILUMI_11856 [Ignelater luminosus]
MAPRLYMMETCPAVRSVLLTAKALGITLDLVRMDLSKGENLIPEYLKLNPQHTVPTLDDDGLVITDSHSIDSYLVEKYASGNSLYPKDPCQRAILNQRLYFDSGVLFPRMLTILKPLLQKEKDIPNEKLADVIEAYEFLEKFLEDQQWIAGNSVTLADLSLIATVTSSDVIVSIDEKKFPNIVGWIKRAKDLPYYSANEAGLDMFRNLVKGLLNA